MQQIPEKQKKQLITLSLAGAVLLAGIVAGFLVVQNQQFVQNRAATTPISCQLPEGKCTVPAPDAAGYSPYIINVKEISSDKIIATSVQGATEVSFAANPLMRYKCEVVATGNSTCTTSTEKDAPLCKTPDGPQENPKTPPPDSPNTPPGEPNIPIPDDPEVKACACAADGGTLDCTPRTEGYEGEKGPGLIYINPKYEKGPGMCFRCKKLVVSYGDTVEESYDCNNPIPTSGALLPTPGIRLHVAKGADCRNYTIKVVGEKINATAAEPTGAVCGNCQGQVCCPVCAPIVETNCGEFESNGKKFTCDFNLNMSCGAIGKEMILKPAVNNTSVVSVDYDDPYDEKGGNSHTYNNAGVYDIKMTCNYYDGTSSVGTEKVCKKTVTVGCGAPPEITPPNTTYDCPKITFVNKDMCIK